MAAAPSATPPRRSEASNRRVQHVELTEGGIELFDRLREVAVRHDERLRSTLDLEETAQLGELLDRLEASVSSGR